jgi:hypothetical protein
MAVFVLDGNARAAEARLELYLGFSVEVGTVAASQTETGC